MSWPVTARLSRGIQRALYTLILHLSESNAPAGKFAQNADVVDDGITALEGRLQRRGRAQVPFDESALSCISKLGFASRPNEQRRFVTVVEQCGDEVAADESGASDDRDFHTRMLSVTRIEGKRPGIFVANCYQIRTRSAGGR